MLAGRCNTQQPFEYGLSHILWSAFSLLWYRWIIFRPLPGMSAGSSGMLLAGLVIVCAAAGWLLTQRNHRNSLQKFATLLLPYEIYTVFTLGRYFRLGLVLSFAVAVLSSAAICAGIFSHPIRKTLDRRRVLFSRIRRSVVASRTLLALSLSPMLIFAIVTQLNGGIPLAVTSAAQISSDAWGDLVDENISTLTLLDPAKWNDLTAAQRLGVLQTVANLEQSSLGIPHELTVKTDILDQDVLGHYSYMEHQITIDVQHLEDSSSEEALITVLHECYHAYQHVLVEAYSESDERYRQLSVFSRARQYVQDFSHYATGSDEEDFLDYYLQSVELDARIYADFTAGEYLDTIGVSPDGEEAEPAPSASSAA